MTEADLRAMILTLQTQVDQLADKVDKLEEDRIDTLEARLTGAVSEIEKLKQEQHPITQFPSPDSPYYHPLRGRRGISG